MLQECGQLFGPWGILDGLATALVWMAWYCPLLLSHLLSHTCGFLSGHIRTTLVTSEQLPIRPSTANLLQRSSMEIMPTAEPCRISQDNHYLGVHVTAKVIQDLNIRTGHMLGDLHLRSISLKHRWEEIYRLAKYPRHRSGQYVALLQLCCVEKSHASDSLSTAPTSGIILQPTRSSLILPSQDKTTSLAVLSNKLPRSSPTPISYATS